MNTMLEQPQQQQALTVRVVFDGPADAGKTTATQALSAAMGSETVSHADEDGQTALFDWMTYSGGQYEGQPIRVEVVTVPSQDEMVNRRRHLLAWGDAIVFIADTSEEEFAHSVAKFDELRTDLASRADVPIVVVANKRDLTTSLSLDEVREQLGLAESDWLIEAVATSGGGIQEALIFAVRSALAGSRTRAETTNPAQLLSQLQALPALRPPVIVEDDFDEDVADVAFLQDARLNKDGVTDGAVIIMQQHWRLLVDIANGRTEISFANSEEAATALELATWGLITGTQVKGEIEPEAEAEIEAEAISVNSDQDDPAEQFRASCDVHRTMDAESASPSAASPSLNPSTDDCHPTTIHENQS